MSPHGKLDILRSLDYLLYCHYVYSYFLDASLLVLLFRIFLQLVNWVSTLLVRPFPTTLLKP